jgi:hypothetical protein
VVIDELVQLDSVDKLEQIIRRYLGSKNSRGEPMTVNLLDELRARFRGSHAARPTRALLSAIFRAGEEIIGIEWTGKVFELSPRTQIVFLVQSMLQQWGIERAGDELIEAFETAASPAFLAAIYLDRGRELGIFPSSSKKPPAIKSEAFERLGQILAPKIDSAVADGTLANAPVYFHIIPAWAHLRGSEQVKSWLAAGIKDSAEFMVKAGMGLVSYTLGAERHYTMEGLPDRDFYDLSTLVDAGKKHLAEAALTQDQRNLLTEIVRSAEQLQERREPEKTDVSQSEEPPEH